MTELYLIAHKVRGEPAFDVATQIECVECEGLGLRYEANDALNCAECDGEGFWCIIPTSGHRAYPYWSKALDDLHGEIVEGWADMILQTMPEGLPDHYPDRKAPTNDLKALLANLPKPMAQPIRRR